MGMATSIKYPEKIEGGSFYRNLKHGLCMVRDNNSGLFYFGEYKYDVAHGRRTQYLR